MKLLSQLAAVFLLLANSLTVQAQSSYYATNDNQDATCSISCERGQAAVCHNASGSNTPSCECLGSSNEFLKSRFSNVELLASQARILTEAQRIEQTDVVAVINQRLSQLEPPRLLRRLLRLRMEPT